MKWGDLGQSQRLAVMRELKKSSGLCVADLAERLGMSYMGAKQHCLSLEKKAYLTSRNQHRGAGRPQLVYRLTQRGQQLFALEDNRLAISILRQAITLFGATAAGKLLYLHFQERTKDYISKIPSGEPLQSRLVALAQMRDEEGCMARAENGCIVEHHCPWNELYEAFPEAIAMEVELFTKVLGVTVNRQVVGGGDHYEIRFEAFRCGVGES